MFVSLWEQGGDAGQSHHTRSEALCQGTAAQFEARKARGERGIGGAEIEPRHAAIRQCIGGLPEKERVRRATTSLRPGPPDVIGGSVAMGRISRCATCCP